MQSITFLYVSILMLRAGFCNKAQPGSDVTLRCEVSLLSDSSTLQWERYGPPTSNTTLMYNNSVYIILHNIDEYSGGKYHCRLNENGAVKTVRSQTVNVAGHLYNSKHTIYRQSSNNSDFSLICKSKKNFTRLMWIWEGKNNSKFVMIAAEQGKNVHVNGQIKPAKKSSIAYNGQSFIFHISPVRFNYSGTYKCILNDQNTTYSTTILHTIRVRAEPPGGALRNQSVVLICEVSDVTEPVTLAWLRMKGNRAVLVKEQILKKTNKKRTLTVNMNIGQTDQPNWQCAVFTENILRALAPIRISLISSDAPDISTETSILTDLTSTLTDQDAAAEDNGTQDSHQQTVILVACAVTVTALILLGVLVFKCQRKTSTGEGQVTEQRSEEEDEIHYASVTIVRPSHGDDGENELFKLKMNSESSKVLYSSETAIYSDIKVQ